MTYQTGDLQLFLSGAWTSVPLLLDAGVRIERGVDPWGAWPRPTKLECRINNDSLNYDPGRPASLLYGVAGRNSLARFYSNTNARVWVEATTWEPDRTPEHVPGTARGLAWVDLTAYGLLARLRAWEEPVRSPMFKTISSRATCIGHWSLEDDAGSARPAATVGYPAISRGITFGETDRPQGAKSSAKMSDVSYLSGRFKGASSTAGWQVAFSLKLDVLPSSGTYVDVLTWRTAGGNTWFWAVNNNSYQYRVNAADGSNIYTGSSLWGGDAAPDRWLTVRLKASQVGGNVQLEPAWYAQNGGALWGITDTFAGSVSVPTVWTQPGSPTVSNGHISHVFGVTGLTDNLLSVAAVQSFDGYNGELAWDRYFRVMRENGLTPLALGAAADTSPMGPQPVDSVLNILREVRDTDGGRIDDERFNIATTLRTRRSLYNQTPAVTLTYPSQVAVPFRKLIDATPVKNSVTVKNRDGGETTAVLASGPTSVQAPPAGIGAVPYTQNVNVYDEDKQLTDLASFWLNQLGQSAPRVEELTVDLLANPSLAASVMAVREGDLVRVTGYEYDPIDLMVVGIKEQIGPGALWSVTFQTEPGEFWRIGVYDDGVTRYDTRTMVLAGGGVTSAALSLTSNVTDPNDVLTTAAGSYPLDLIIGQGDGTGEVVRATGASAAGAGPTYAQTITLSTRAVNGVARAWPAGMDISVHDSRRWGL